MTARWRSTSHLGPAAARLEGYNGAYLLHLDGGGGTDVALVRSLLATAGGSAPALARRLLGEARSLWRGEPLAEFIDVAPLAPVAVALGGLRRTVDEAYAAAALDAGVPGDAVDAAATATRTRVLHVARRAITRHHGAASICAGQA